jgi:hypothetical protein
MDKNEFKKILRDLAFKHGFIIKDKVLYRETDTLIIIIDFQKSNYSNSFYINYGFLIKEINGDMGNLKNIAWDAFGRVLDNKKEKYKDCFELEYIDRLSYLETITNFFDNIIETVALSGINIFFEINPKYINTLNEKARKYLNIK